MAALLRIAWRNIWRQRRRSAITIGAIAFGVAMCMGFICVDDGMFADIYRMMVRERIGHVQVHAPDWPAQRAIYETLEMDEELLAMLDEQPATAAVTSRLFGFALLGVGEKSSGVQLTGVHPSREDAVTGVAAKVTPGRWLAADASREIVLGAGLAEKLKAELNDEVVAVTQAADGSLGNELYTLVGVARSGNVAADQAGAWLHMDDLQELLVLPGQAHELALVGQEDGDFEQLADSTRRWMDAGAPLLVRTWKEVDPMTGKMLDMQDAATWILLVIVFSVAALGIMNTMLMAVFERTAELGVLQALGMRPGQVVALVMLETLLLSAVGVLVGGLLGGGLDLWLVQVGIDLGSWAEGMNFSGMHWEPVLRGAFRWEGVVATVVVVLVVAAIASIWPALRAARLRPVEAMREE